MPHSANTPDLGSQSSNSHGSESRSPAQQEKTINNTECQRPTATVTMSAQEWTKTHRDFKTTIQGQRYVLRMTSHGTGTSLVPVIVVKGARS